REFADVPPITVDKNRALQILVNLVKNAKHACDDSRRSDKRVTLRISRCPLGVSIVVTDNGVGIPAQNMTRIFSHGFTTRKNGHGFGLHSGALAARELGGSLAAASDGPGCGAVFTLQLPLTPPKASP
ncbi:MAG: ATP-binding protein, partial [Gammaproteobacteria bacterium]